MSRIVLCFFAACTACVWADTLDFSQQKVVVTLSEDGGVAFFSDNNMDARALSVLEAASYDRDLTVDDFLAAHPREAARLKRMTLNGQRGATKYLSDGSVSTEYDFSLTGAVLNQLVPKTGGGRLLGRVACPCCGQEWPEGREVPPGVELVPYENGRTPAYTGILIDCRGLGYEPAVFPKVVTEADEEVYGPGFVEEKELAADGMVAYYRTRTEALMSERVGASPLVVRAIGITGMNSCDPVVTAYDAARIHGSRSNLGIMARCRVGFLVD